MYELWVKFIDIKYRHLVIRLQYTSFPHEERSADVPQSGSVDLAIERLCNWHPLLIFEIVIDFQSNESANNGFILK